MSVANVDTNGGIAGALWEASLLLGQQPRAAIERAADILRVHPGQIDATLLSARAARGCDDLDGAERFAEALFAREASHGLGLRERALILLARGEPAQAHKLLERHAAAIRDDAGIWSLLADLRQRSGDETGAERAVRTAMAAAVDDKECLAAALALREERLSEAEHLLRLRLRDFPTDVTTVRMMAELATRLGRFDDAEKLLRRALQIAPWFHDARELLARNLQRGHRPADALKEVAILLESDPRNPSLAMLKASLLVKTGDQEAARCVYEQVLADHPNQPKGWMSLGHVLKTLGRQEEGISAYRRAIRQQPTLGEAWWSLANLKTVRFTPGDVAAMEQALLQATDDDDRLHLHFALGKAAEDAGAYQAAFRHWERGNALHRKSSGYDADEIHRDCVRGRAFFTAQNLAATRGVADPDPIFIVGMPRSGSTLVEQILASHSQIEGTMELPDMMEIAGRLKRRAQQTQQTYPDILTSLAPDEILDLGREYLDRTRIHRKSDRPYFIDKMPNNWAHVGLIRTILPNAHIIDTRRHPVGNCLSMWKQHFARGQHFAYDLVDLARYYREYVDYMAHFDRIAPDLVCRVVYERLVANSEAEIGKLLDHLGLPFEASCLTFWRNDRAVRTPSSEQVRQPIFADAVDHWQRFAPWLGPLMTELGPTIDAHPN